MSLPHFTINNRFQKRSETYEEILTPDILSDVADRVFRKSGYSIEFVDKINVGRLATLEYRGKIAYISFSEKTILSRNSSFQSFSSALVRFLEETNTNKSLCFYFLPSEGNQETKYFGFMYRLMRTAGTVFLNAEDYLSEPVRPFNSEEDIVLNKDALRSRNRGNKSTYITRSEDDALQIYGKTYGASKYETTLLCLAVSKLVPERVELFEIAEGGLIHLPRRSREAILRIGNIEIVESDLAFERRQFDENDSLRSPLFIYNLLEKFGAKRCALCDCEIPQLIEGAHIWPVSRIKRATHIDQAAKLQAAVDSENGLWLCANHHKLFDIDHLMISDDGVVRVRTALQPSHEDYVHSLTLRSALPQTTLTKNLANYLGLRNANLDPSLYVAICTR